MRGRGLLLWALVAVGFGVAVSAETPDVGKAEADLERLEQRTNEISKQLDAGDPSDGELQSLLEELVGFQNDVDNDTEVLTAALKGPSDKLDELGPPPAADQPQESADIAKLRTTLSDEIANLQGLAKRADLIRSEADRLIRHLRRLQSARFRSKITSRSVSPFSPILWTAAAADIPPALDRMVRIPARWWEDQRAGAKPAANLALLLVALAGAAMLLALPRRPRWRRFEATIEDNPSPSALDRRRRVAWRVTSRGLLTLGAGGLLLGAAIEAGVVRPAGMPLAVRLWLAGAMVVVASSFARGVFSPRRPEWRIAPCNPAKAARLQTIFVAVFGLFVIDRVLAAGFQLSGAGVELTLAQAAVGNVLFAALLWLLTRPSSWRPAGGAPGPDAQPESPSDPPTDPPSNESAAEPVGASTSWRLEAVRSGGQLLAVVMVVATTLAYLRLANFVFHRVLLLAAFLILMWSIHIVVVWALGRPWLSKPADPDKPADGDDGAPRGVGLWLHMAVDLTLLTFSVPAFLLIVGFDWFDLTRWFGLLNDDIRVGAVSFSFNDILTAVVVFLLVSIGTRWTTAAVEKRLLQHTRLEVGALDSITTLINYTGVAVGVVLALAVLGVGLTRLTVVAGALSVGIGFGLQNVVNNFVSGLILLFERPIRVGDWVVTASGQGYVKHIGGRATEIESFDRASILVPNSDLVSSPVQNWYLHNRRGRVRVDVGVAYGSDPNTVRDILLRCAEQHMGVSGAPRPSVLWTGFGDSSIDFELRAYVRNYDDAYTIMSELRFAIFDAFKEAGIEIPFPQRDVHLGSGRPPADGDATPKHIEEETT